MSDTRSYRHWTNTEVRELERLYLLGLSYVDIARTLNRGTGCTNDNARATIISSALRRHGIIARHGGRSASNTAWTPAEVRDLETLYKAGLKYADIANHLGRGGSTNKQKYFVVYHALVKHGYLTPRTRKQRQHCHA